MSDNEEKEISIGAHSKTSITFTNLLEEEAENLQGMLHNHFWVSVDDGRLEVIRRKKEVPGPADDEEMMPFWSRPAAGVSQQIELFDVDIPRYSHPSIIIQSLCGYNRTPERYKEQVELVESFGFVCLRSRRGNDAKFWEMWYLPGLWHAQGELKEFIATLGEKENVKTVVRFLCKRVEFGTLNLSFQKAAMVRDD